MRTSITLRLYALAVLLGVALCLGLSTASSGQAVDAGPAGSHISSAPRLYTLRFANEAHLDRLAATLDVWEVNHSDRTVTAMLSAAQMDALLEEGESLVGTGQSLPWRPQPFASTSELDTVPGFACYRTMKGGTRELRELAEENPQLAAWIDIGDSWDKLNPAPPVGHDIQAIIITNRDKPGPKFKFLIVAAVHARELVTSEIAVRFAEYLVAHYGEDPDVTWLLDYGEVHIVPFANPDGRLYAEQLYYWRKNTNSADGCTLSDQYGNTYGVDLNRNADFRWNGCETEGCSSSDPCSPTFRGRSAASEPETAALQAYTASLFRDQAPPELDSAVPITATGLMVSLHSYAELVMFPWAWSSEPAPNEAALRTLGERLAEPLGYRVCQTGEAGCLYRLDGDLADWAYGRLGIAAYTFEFGTAFFQECGYFEYVILDDAIEALKLAFKHAPIPYALANGPTLNHVRLSADRVIQGTSITVTASTLVSVGQAVPAVELRYSLDGPPWPAEQRVAEPMPASQNTVKVPMSVSTRVDTKEWRPGRHLLVIQALDREGVAGIPYATWVDIVLDRTAYLPLVTHGKMSDR